MKRLEKSIYLSAWWEIWDSHLWRLVERGDHRHQSGWWQHRCVLPHQRRLHHWNLHLLEPRLYWQFWHKQIISNNIIPKMVKTKNWQTSALKMRADVSNCDKWPRRGQMGRRPFMWLTPGKSLEEVRNLGKDSAMEMCLVEELQRHPVMNSMIKRERSALTKLWNINHPTTRMQSALPASPERDIKTENK